MRARSQSPRSNPSFADGWCFARDDGDRIAAASAPPRTAANFSRLPKSRDRRSIGVADPIMGRAPKLRRRQWDKTSEVPAVHGALRWWALSKAVKPHFLKPSWRERAPSPKPAASMPELPSAMPAPKPATTRWASASPPPPPPSWATATPLSIVPVRSSSRMTCAPRSRGRCRGRGLRGGREEAAATADHPARARGARHSAIPVSEQDRPRQQAHPRDAGDLAAGLARAAGAAADSDLERRVDRRFRRSRAGARLRLSRAQAVRSRRIWKAAISTARRKRGSRCWKSSPTTTTR